MISSKKRMSMRYSLLLVSMGGTTCQRDRHSATCCWTAQVGTGPYGFHVTYRNIASLFVFFTFSVSAGAEALDGGFLPKELEDIFILVQQDSIRVFLTPAAMDFVRPLLIGVEVCWFLR